MVQSGFETLCRYRLEDLLPEYLSIWGWSGSTQKFIDFWLKSEDRPHSEVLECVDELRRCEHRCYLASNQERNRAEYIDRHIGFGQRFDELFFSCDLGLAKPDHRFFDVVAHQISADPSEIKFWDDSEVYVEAAADAGWEAALFVGLDSLRQINSTRR